MLKIRKASDRGHADHGWLNTYHTFSFASYQHPEHMSFRALRVMNEDRVAPGQGFGTHSHRDMEIVSYVLDGALEHKDSMGNGEVLKPGEFQRITAGTGIQHSEFNPSSDQPAHFYQIWLLPESKGLEPGYEQKSFDPAERQNRLQLVAEREPTDGALKIHQDAKIFLGNIAAGKQVGYEFGAGRHGWLQVFRGSVNVDGNEMSTSDGLAISDVKAIEIRAVEDAEIMLFDLA